MSVLLLLSIRVLPGVESWQSFNKQAFYQAMASGDIDEIDTELSKIETGAVAIKETGTEKDAYEGALLMKKAGLVSKPAEKLRFFKAGRIKLETCLAKDGANGEYHFLRLIIQEHAPGIVHYRANLKTDSEYIHHTFKNLSPVVQKAITDYSKHSKILRPEDF